MSPLLTRPAARRRNRLGSVAALLPLSLLLASCSTEPPSSNNAPTPPPNNSGNAPSNGPATADSGATATTGFETARKPDGEVFIQIVTNGISPFWDPMAVGMKKAAEELGCRAEWAGPQNATFAEQKRLVEDAIAKGADGIAISCIDAQSAQPLIDAALEKKVPIITFDSDSPTSKRLAYIGTNNTEAGKAAGKAAAEMLPDGGKFVGFVGNISAENARQRKDGFVEASKDHKIDLLDVLDDNKDASRARRNVEDVMAKHGSDLQGLLGLFSYNGPAIAQAVASAGKRSQYKIIAFDAEPVTLQELEKGNIDATIVQKPYDFGYLSTKLLFLINRKGFPAAKQELKVPDDGLYDTGVEVITPKNVKEYRQRLKDLGIKSS